jgi:hypothetical protein
VTPGREVAEKGRPVPVLSIDTFRFDAERDEVLVVALVIAEDHPEAGASFAGPQDDPFGADVGLGMRQNGVVEAGATVGKVVTEDGPGRYPGEVDPAPVHRIVRDHRVDDLLFRNVYSYLALGTRRAMPCSRQNGMRPVSSTGLPV